MDDNEMLCDRKDTLLLSIIVPVYNMNRNNMLNECVESLIDQSVGTLGKYEVIFVDDCSTDDSLNVLRDYERRFPELIRVIARDRNGRQGAARNTGLRAAAGKWIGFVDSDDWVHRDMYYKLIRRAEETGADCATCYSLTVRDRSLSVPEGELVPSNFREGDITPEQTERTICLGENMWNKIYLRSTLTDNDLFFPENIFYEDNAVAAYFYIMSKRIAVVSEPLYYYYVNPGSTCNDMTINKIEDRLSAGDFFLKTARRLGIYESRKELISFGYFGQVFVMGLVHVWRVNAGFKERRRLLSEIRGAVLANCPGMEKNRLFSEYYPGLIRPYRLLKRSVTLYMAYHYYRER